MRILRILCALSAVLIINMGGNASTITNNSQWDENDRKSGYYVIESKLAMQRGDAGTHYEMLKRAVELNPANSVAQYYLGICKLVLAQTDTAQTEALMMMKSHIKQHPEDVLESRRYAMYNIKLNRFDEAAETYKRIISQKPNSNEDKYSLAQALSLGKHYSEAIAVYDSLEVTEGIEPQISVQKISIYISLNDTANVLREAHRLYDTAPKSVTNNEILGNVYQHLGMPDSAIVYYDRMDEIDPTNANGALAKVSYYYQRGDSVQMDKEMYRALSNENMPIEQKVQELTRYIRTMYQDGDSSERVINLFNVILEQNPHEAAVRRLYAMYLSTRGDYSGASEQLSYALDIEPTNIEDWLNMIVLQMQDKNYEKALSMSEKALEYHPDNEDVVVNMPVIYSQMKQYDKQFEACERAMAIVDSTDYVRCVSIYNMMGDALYFLGKKDEAYKSYEKGLKLDPENGMIMNNYAYFLACDGRDLEKAEEMSRKTVLKKPEEPTYLDTYAWVLFKKHNLEQAKIYIELAIKNEPEPTSDLLEHYGDILFFMGEPEKALEQWEEALKLSPDNEILKTKVSKKTYVYE